MGMCRDRERYDVIVEGLGFSVVQLGFQNILREAAKG